MSGSGLIAGGSLLFGRLLPRSLLMLVMRVFGKSAWGVLLLLCLLLPQHSSGVFLIAGEPFIRCLLPIGAGRFKNLVVLYGYQGSNTDAKRLALTEQLFDAALGELGVVARGQPCLIVFNVEPTKMPCLAKGISAGLWVDLEAAWALARGSQPAVTCKRTRDSAGGHRRDFRVGCNLAAAAVVSCGAQPQRWTASHLAVRTYFDVGRWACKVTQPVQFTPLWLAFWLLAVDKSRGSKSADVVRV